MTEKKHSLSAKTREVIFSVKETSSEERVAELEELYQSLFREPIKGAHDALIDVEATVRCFNELRSRGEINDNKRINGDITRFRRRNDSSS